MNNSTLEKMAWLYQQGFKNDLWTDGAKSPSYAPSKRMYGNYYYDHPYFSESCLWNLLPQDFYCLKEHVSYERKLLSGYLGYWRVDQYGANLTATSFETLGNLHSALLDLTIWAVKEEHLKAEVKSE